MIYVLGWGVAFGCLVAYLHLALTGRAVLYHWSNVIGGIALIWFNLATAGWSSGPNLVIEGFYSVIAAVAIRRARHG